MAFFKNLWTFLTETIFLKDERNYRNGLIRWGVRQYKLLFYTARGLDEHDTLVRSAALTFYTLMSIVPIAALVFAVVKGFGLADGLMQNLYSLFPHNREVVDYLITFADKALAAAQGGVVAFVGIVMLFWAVVRVFGSVEEAFNNIWEVKVSRSFTRQFTDYIAVVVITPILWVVGSTAGRYAGHLLGIDSFGALYTLLSGAVSLLGICTKMKIQFEIKEKLPEIIAEIMHSDKWQTKILEKMHGLERITIKDPNYKSEACIEIWQHEIHIRTAWSNYTYRIFTRGNAVWCEYIGAYRGLLEQKLLPSLTPKMNILDSEVVESSLTGNKRQTLRTYSSENLKLKNFRRDNFKEEYNVTSPQDHPTVVYDEYIKEGMPMPSPYGDSQQSK